MERRESKQEKEALVGTTMDEKFYTRSVKHSGDLVTGTAVVKNEPNQEQQRKHNRRQKKQQSLFPRTFLQEGNISVDL